EDDPLYAARLLGLRLDVLQRLQQLGVGVRREDAQLDVAVALLQQAPLHALDLEALAPDAHGQLARASLHHQHHLAAGGALDAVDGVLPLQVRGVGPVDLADEIARLDAGPRRRRAL